jgi:quercetin dioxygenase-like cupin family protein
MAIDEADTVTAESTDGALGTDDTIENPVTGERISFLKRSRDTDGEFVRLEVAVEPNAIGPPEHLHPTQEEYFRVLSGTLSGRVDGKAIRMEQGEELTVWSGTPHGWWNDDDEELRVLIEMRPALQFEEFLETIHGLGRDGKTNDEGFPNLFQLAVFGQAYWNDVRVVRPPAIVQRLMYAILAPIGRRLLGYKSCYREYSPLDGKWSQEGQQ